MAIFRNKKSRYFLVPNEVLWDVSLSLDAKGLYCKICSYTNNPDFKLTKDYLMQKEQEKTEDFENAWEELNNKGYLEHFEEIEG